MTQKLYDQDSHCRAFSAQVLTCQPGAAGTWQVTLDRTAFFPEGGGQPADRGTLGGAAVLDVQEVGEAILHTTDAPLTPRHHRPGDPGLAPPLWPDAVPLRGACDLRPGPQPLRLHQRGLSHGRALHRVDFDGVLTLDDVLDVERRANAAIREDVSVEALLPSPAELAAMDYRSKKDHDGQIRVVRIDGVDSCACCGTHVSSTGQVGLIKILRTATKKKRTRLELLCGRRALEACEDAMAAFRETSNFLTVADEEVPEAVQRLSAEKDDLKHQLKQAGRKQIDHMLLAWHLLTRLPSAKSPGTGHRGPPLPM